MPDRFYLLFLLLRKRFLIGMSAATYVNHRKEGGTQCLGVTSTLLISSDHATGHRAQQGHYNPRDKPDRVG